MRVQCPNCGAGGNIPDEKIPPAGRNITCPKCKSSFFIQKQEPQENNHQDATVHYNEGIKLLKERQIDAAIEKFNMAIQINPEYGEAYRYLGLAYGQKNLWAESIQILEKAISYQPDDLQSLKNLGVAYLQQKEFAKAEQVLEKTLQIDPDDEKTKSYLAMAIRGKEQQQPSATTQEPIPSPDTNETPSSEEEPSPAREKAHMQRNPVRELLDKGTEHLDNGQYNQAIETFNEVCRIDPNNSDGYFGLAMVYEQRKDRAKAIEMYEKVLELNSEDSIAQESLKFLKKQQKKFRFPWQK